jgi:hypothetical protein
MWAVFRGICAVIGPKGYDFTYELMSTDMTASRGCHTMLQRGKRHTAEWCSRHCDKDADLIRTAQKAGRVSTSCRFMKKKLREHTVTLTIASSGCRILQVPQP